MDKIIFKRISTWILIITVLLIVFFIIIYSINAEIIIKIPIWGNFTPKILFWIIIWLSSLGFSLYKWFRRWEIINEYNEMNRMKSHLFNNMKHEEFKQIINLSYIEIIWKYNWLEARKTMQELWEKVENLKTPIRK